MLLAGRSEISRQLRKLPSPDKLPIVFLDEENTYSRFMEAISPYLGGGGRRKGYMYLSAANNPKFILYYMYILSKNSRPCHFLGQLPMYIHSWLVI